MERWNDLIWQIRTSALWNELPPGVREPPGLYFLLGGLLVFALIALTLLIRLVGRRLRRMGRATGQGGTSARHDLKAALERGDLLAAAELQQSFGRSHKALALLAQGGHRQERVELLRRLGRRDEARKAAKEDGLWHVVAEMAGEDGDAADAALAWERAGKSFLAARAWEEAGDRLQAARCFTAAGLESEAVRVLGKTEGREAAEILESAVRASLAQASGTEAKASFTS